MKRSNGRKERGAVLFVTAILLLLVILPAVGLAIDGAVAFIVKARLQTASDAAALAAARSLSRGVTLNQQRDSAEQTAQMFFAANIGGAWTDIRNAAATVSWPAAPPKTSVVRVDGAVDAPTYFMRLFGYTTLRVRASGTASRRDVNIVLVLDRSGSIETLGACDDLRSAAKGFVDTFVDGRDRLGLVTFGTSYRVDYPPNFNFKSGSSPTMVNMIDNIQCVGGTNSASAYWTAWERLAAINEPNTLNVILFFTDGQPNAVYVDKLEVKLLSTCLLKTMKSGVVLSAGTKVWGIFQPYEPTAPPARNPDYVAITNSIGCAFLPLPLNLDQDIVALSPSGAASEKDVFGNALTGYKPVNRDGLGRIRINDTTTLTNVSSNALDNAAARVRALSYTSGLDVYTYCIALGGAPAPAEATLMQRIANTADSPTYNSTYPEGLYVVAANTGQLNQAFLQLASDILRVAE